MSSKNKPNIDQINNLKNMVSGNLLEFIKPQIKNHQNENVLKIMDMIHDHPDIWLEFLSLSIVHKNYSIMKYMIETFRINPNQKSFLNSLTFYNDILPDNSNLRINDHKELFIDVEVPFEILCAIGGDREIFDYLKQKKFIKNIGNSSVIGLTKKQKNAFFSNAIGASCYYGRSEYLKYILNNGNLNIDFETTEKKAKNKHISFNKEFTNFTPIFLAIASEIAKEEESIECIKILNEAKCNLEMKDFDRNNILHVAVKNKKIKILKFLVENLDLKSLINETNKKGQTPSGIAINEGFNEISEYLKSYNVIDENLQKDLEDLINEEEGKKKKGKKKKKKKKENKKQKEKINKIKKKTKKRN
jgi:ankyrin repeat protein